METIDKDNTIKLKQKGNLNEDTSDNGSKLEWQDWCTNTFNYTVDSIENLEMVDILKYINQIKGNIKNNTSPYSEEYLNECLMWIEAVINGSYECIDMLENIGAYYPDREEFIECLKRVSETID